MWFFRSLIKSHYSSNFYTLEGREIPPSMFPPCTAAIQSALLPAAYSNTSLLNNFKSQRQLWPIHTVAPPKPSSHPSIPPSVPPLIPFHSGTIRSLSQSRPWLGAQSSAGPVWTQLWTLNLSFSALHSLVSWLPLHPDSISAFFRRVLDEGLDMQWMLLCTVYRARLNTLRVSSRAQQ